MDAPASLSMPAARLEEGVQSLLLLPGAHHLVLFTADPDPTTGVSWCPDCVRAVPAVKRVLAARGVPLLEVQVGPRADWRAAVHPLRLHPGVQLGGVPELMAWSRGGGAGARMAGALERAASAEEAAALVERFLDSLHSGQGAA